MDLNAPNIDYVIAAYVIAVAALLGLVFAVARAYKNGRDES